MKLSSITPRYAAAATLVLGCTMLGADCDGDIVNDPTFRDWCGDSLCSWTTDSGTVAQAATWSPDDLGVSFVTQGTEISQVTSESQATCILFTTVGDFDTDAQMTLGVDFNNDGTIDVSPTIPAVTWQETKVLITAPASYNGITFYISKGGTGTAILAEMRIQSSTGCTDAPPKLADLKLGEACSGGESCGGSLYCQANTVWFGSTCGECRDNQDCASGVTCERRGGNLPLQCGPGRGLGASGYPCLASDDCKSGVCGGVSVSAGPDGGIVALDGGVGLDGGVDLLGGSCSLDAGADASAGCYANVSEVVGGKCQ
jgi:hypothetical protein